MSDFEIMTLLKKHPIVVKEGNIIHGKHRVCAMIGRLIKNKPYISFYIQESVPRFTMKMKQ